MIMHEFTESYSVQSQNFVQAVIAQCLVWFPFSNWRSGNPKKSTLYWNTLGVRSHHPCLNSNVEFN